MLLQLCSIADGFVQFFRASTKCSLSWSGEQRKGDGSGGCRPIVDEFGDHRIGAGEVNSSVFHPPPGHFFCYRVAGPASIANDLHFEPFERGADRRTYHANVGCYACHDEVLLARGAASVGKGRIIPGIDNALPFDPFGFFASVIIRLCLSAGLLYGNLYFLIPVVFKRSKLLYWVLLLAAIVLFVITYRSVYLITTKFVWEVPTELWVKTINRLFAAFRFLLTSVFLKFIQDWFLQEKKINEITTAQLSTELHYLRSQVNPHFLFNTLNNIYSLTLKKSDKAPEVVLRLSEMMEYMLNDTSEEKVSVEKEVKNLSNYLEIERIRQGNNATIEFSISGDYHNKKIMPLLLLPLLENAVKHGINQTITGGYLIAKLNVMNQHLVFTVENNKATTNKEDKRVGIGIQNLMKRLDLLYKGKHQLQIDDTPEKYKVELVVTLS